jgi:hypothetical protein
VIFPRSKLRWLTNVLEYRTVLLLRRKPCQVTLAQLHSTNTVEWAARSVQTLACLTTFYPLSATLSNTERNTVTRVSTVSTSVLTWQVSVFISGLIMGHTVTDCGLDDRGSRVRFPEGAGNCFLHHRVQNGSGAHPASYPMSSKAFFLGGKAAGAWSDHSPPSSAAVKNAWSHTSTPPIRLHGVVLS